MWNLINNGIIEQCATHGNVSGCLLGFNCIDPFCTISEGIAEVWRRGQDRQLWCVDPITGIWGWQICEATSGRHSALMAAVKIKCWTCVPINHIVTVVLIWMGERTIYGHTCMCLLPKSCTDVRWRWSRQLLRTRWCWRFKEMRVWHTLSQSLLFWRRNGNFTSFAQKQLRSTMSNWESWTAKNSWLSRPKQGFFSRWLVRKEWECNMCVLPWSRRMSLPHAT